MRLHVNVTPAHLELLEHLESIDKEYRGKRLVALAAMQLHEMKTTPSIRERTIQQSAIREQPAQEPSVQEQLSQEQPPLAEPPSQEQLPVAEADDQANTRAQQRTAPKWLGGLDEKD